ncbi:hypothetical protein [Clostridium botulinum]|uniref:hypothetical protein n=1 Tax=Clostridium botulinum TaxID=1491 RepID=UPI0007744C54|nr:hypothetical protein [Clostridium botulinum]MBY6931866.1 hypothetical protein [Clostridium botulinum]NFG20568.1 hypothetical protein [Clostridium botulinum]NFO81126.1 hypothetical protein [Clostridium botulinum]
MENSNISIEYLIDVLDPKELDFENIGRSLAQKENKWYEILDKVKNKENGLELLENLEYAKGHFKNEIFFKYIDTRVRKQEYEVIKALISTITEDIVDKHEKEDKLYQYIKEEIGFQNLGFKSFPMPILPRYENITIENVINMLKIIGLEKEVNFNKESV